VVGWSSYARVTADVAVPWFLDKDDVVLLDGVIEHSVYFVVCSLRIDL
jgi:hypothetical protein